MMEVVTLSTNRHTIAFSENEETNFNFKTLFISQAKYESDWISLIHTHPFTEIFYVIGGEGSFITNQHQFEVMESDVIIVNANVEHTEVSSAENPLEYIAIGIQDVSFISSTTSEFDQPFIFYNFQDKKKEVLFYLKNIIEEAESKSSNYEYICHNLLNVLFLKLLRQSNLKIEVNKQNNIGRNVAIAKQYIDHKFKENITLDVLAKITFLDRFYLSRTFKNEVGYTPIEYLNKQRIKEAKVLLRTTNFNISQIASIVGFTSQSYFTEVFNKQELITPSKFRKLHPSK